MPASEITKALYLLNLNRLSFMGETRFTRETGVAWLKKQQFCSHLPETCLDCKNTRTPGVGSRAGIVLAAPGGDFPSKLPRCENLRG
jgi:hypothetical protein